MKRQPLVRSTLGDIKYPDQLGFSPKSSSSRIRQPPPLPAKLVAHRQKGQSRERYASCKRGGSAVRLTCISQRSGFSRKNRVAKQRRRDGEEREREKQNRYML